MLGNFEQNRSRTQIIIKRDPTCQGYDRLEEYTRGGGREQQATSQSANAH